MQHWESFLDQTQPLYSLVGIRELDGRTWKDMRVYPLYAGVISSIFLLLHIVILAIASSKSEQAEVSKGETEVRPGSAMRRLKSYASRFGGTGIFAFLVARLVCSLGLLGLSIASTVRSALDHQESSGNYVQAAIMASYTYTTLLATISVLSSKWSMVATRHNILVLLVAFGAYLYRDLWPLATTNLTPRDIDEGRLLWAKVGILAIAAVLIPLFVPRRYVPVDPEHPMEKPNPEQTASIFSFMFYNFLNPVIYEASRVTHLAHSQLPPLCDYDRAKYRTEKNLPHLDSFKGSKKRHIFWNIMRVYRTEYIVNSLNIFAIVLFGFAPPIAINRTLSYLETGGDGTTIRPWFWIVFLFVGPTVKNLIWEWYLFIQTRMLVQTEGLLTHLVFEHSLRIRMKAETEDVAPSSPNDAVDSKGKAKQPSDAASTKSVDTGSSSTLKNPEKVRKQGDNLTGKINNLVTNDLGSITDARDFLQLFLMVPLQAIGCAAFLYVVLGWSAFVGIFSIIVMLPLPGYVAKRMQGVQKTKMKKTDSRVQTVTEIVNSIRMIKLFGWEEEMSKRIDKTRDEELNWTWKRKALESTNSITNSFISAITMLATYGTYTVIMKQELNASKIFSTMPIFGILRGQLYRGFHLMGSVVQGKVALDRFDEFLKNTELLDSFTKQSSDIEQYLGPNEHSNDIGFNEATFTWSNDSENGDTTPSSSTRSFKLYIEEEVIFKQNAINLIIGPTGSGKTSMLMALLGEMHFIPTSASSWYNLPRDGGVAYAAQESWVQNDTIKKNILFNEPYDEDRYKKALRQCALERDLELFDAGDETEVGERGLTLSGGQKGRVTLARAVYSSAQILLLDDVLAALDVHTAKSIVEDCFKGDLVKGRTIILVTHNTALAGPLADFVISVGTDGKITSKGTDISRAISTDPVLEAEVVHDREEITRDNEEIDHPAATVTKKDGKLVIAEEIAEGRVGWKSMSMYITAMGGNYAFAFFSFIAFSMLSNEFTYVLQIWYLGYWGSQYETHAPSEVQDSKYLMAYAGILFIGVVLYTISYLFYVLGSLRASKTIYKKLTSSVLTSTLRWIDETPTSRIIARCTQDTRAVDGPIPDQLYWLGVILVAGIVELAAVVFFTPFFLIPGVSVLIVGIYYANQYIKAQLPVKRELSNAKSPVLAHFGATIHGIVSVRAYGAQDAFRAESLKRIDHYTTVARVTWNLNRWIAVRTDLIGAIFTSALAAYLVYLRSISASNSGFSLNMAVEFCSMILIGVRMFNDVEVQSNSLERIRGYIDIDHEPSSTKNGIPPAAWPKSGDLRVEKLSARYSTNGPRVLHEISFDVKAGERIGIVGRTGSGKSSLTLALLRCIPTDGAVYFDGILTQNINLDALRSNITIIPQSPELLSGTLRKNLDPFEQYDDAILNDALRSAGLFSLQSEMEEGELNLDSNIASGGGNLSVGQRQIIALARAIVRRSKVLILDEATSAIDYKTDAVIQSTLRHELSSDVTVITVAHRLQTVMDADKIMVLDEGRIVEFDTPKKLLTMQGSKLKTLVDESADKKALYAMAEGR